MMFVIIGLCLAFGLLTVISAWKVITMAGEPGWSIFIPIYNTIIFGRVAKAEGALVPIAVAFQVLGWVPEITSEISLFISLGGFLAFVMLCIKVAENFGKSAAFGIGMAFLCFIFFPILAFGNAEYQGLEKDYDEIFS